MRVSGGNYRPPRSMRRPPALAVRKIGSGGMSGTNSIGSPDSSKRNGMEPQNLTKEEALRLAQQELGDVPPADLAAFIDKRFGVKIDPRFIPVLKAMMVDKEHLAEARARARAVAAIQLAESSTQPA